jgi:glycosyltransferase involved in cell wall biosynthesis
MLTASVIIPAYTLDRWNLLSAAVASVQAQTHAPTELILCIDRNPQLLERCEAHWGTDQGEGEFPIHIVPNRFDQKEQETGVHVRAHGSKRRFGAGWARNSGAEIALGDVLVFMDDDAEAEPDWLGRLLEPYGDPTTVAVGGAPLPNYETSRPPWFPLNFDWVFGCAYAGLPENLGPLGHLIGANMSVRREVFEGIGGFHSIDFDDLDLCMRVAAQYPGGTLLYEPNAIVHHFVPAQRVSWHYFWHRCFFVNREKVKAFVEMGEAANIRAEREFVRKAVSEQVSVDLKIVLHGHWVGLQRLGAMFMGLALSAAGYLVGRMDRIVSGLANTRE